MARGPEVRASKVSLIRRSTIQRLLTSNRVKERINIPTYLTKERGGFT